MGRFIKYFDLADGHNSVAIPSGSTAEQPSNPDGGALRFNTSINKLEYYNSTTWLALSGGVGGATTITRDEITLDGSTLVYPGLSITPTADQNVLVFIEGVFQNDTQYSISGTTITLSSILETDEGKKLHVIHGFDSV